MLAAGSIVSNPDGIQFVTISDVLFLINHNVRFITLSM